MALTVWRTESGKHTRNSHLTTPIGAGDTRGLVRLLQVAWWLWERAEEWHSTTEIHFVVMVVEVVVVLVVVSAEMGQRARSSLTFIWPRSAIRWKYGASQVAKVKRFTATVVGSGLCLERWIFLLLTETYAQNEFTFFGCQDSCSCGAGLSCF